MPAFQPHSRRTQQHAHHYGQRQQRSQKGSQKAQEGKAQAAAYGPQDSRLIHTGRWITTARLLIEKDLCWCLSSRRRRGLCVGVDWLRGLFLVPCHRHEWNSVKAWIRGHWRGRGHVYMGGSGCARHRCAAGYVADAAGGWRGAAERWICFPIMNAENPGRCPTAL
jgi:hypothetical protein